MKINENQWKSMEINENQRESKEINASGKGNPPKILKILPKISKIL